MIKTKVLSKILGRRVVSIHKESRIDGNPIAYNFQNKSNPSDGGYISMDDLLVRCREWIKDQGYVIKGEISKDGHYIASAGKPHWFVLNWWFLAGKEEDVVFEACEYIIKDMM